MADKGFVMFATAEHCRLHGARTLYKSWTTNGQTQGEESAMVDITNVGRLLEEGVIPPKIVKRWDTVHGGDIASDVQEMEIRYNAQGKVILVSFFIFVFSFFGTLILFGILTNYFESLMTLLNIFIFILVAAGAGTGLVMFLTQKIRSISEKFFESRKKVIPFVVCLRKAVNLFKGTNFEHFEHHGPLILVDTASQILTLQKEHPEDYHCDEDRRYLSGILEDQYDTLKEFGLVDGGYGPYYQRAKEILAT